MRCVIVSIVGIKQLNVAGEKKLRISGPAGGSG
jgi:hypothetical protein